MKYIKPQIALEKLMECYEEKDNDTSYKNIKHNEQNFRDNFEIVQKALEDLRTYKKALKISCNNDALLRNASVLEKMFLEQARKELNK